MAPWEEALQIAAKAPERWLKKSQRLLGKQLASDLWGDEKDL
jgi:hypothetical protein